MLELARLGASKAHLPVRVDALVNHGALERGGNLLFGHVGIKLAHTASLAIFGTQLATALFG